MPFTPQMVQCSYVGSCRARLESLADGSDGRFPATSMDYCDYCDLWYHLNHSHRNPSSRRNQWCSDCEVYHPACMTVSLCRTCLDASCMRDHECGSDTAEDNYRDPMLLFEGDAGGHTLAMGARYVGMEIEVEQGGDFALPRKFGITDDGSLGYHGIEILTPPSRGSALVENVTQAMETLTGAGYETSEKCGLHVHLDLRDKKEDARYLSRLFVLGFAIEDLLYSLQQTNRHDNHYSMPLRRMYPFFATRGKSTDFEYVYNKRDKNAYSKRVLANQRTNKWGNRYLGFNFHSVYYRGTLECRIHEGTLDPNRILGWADLLQTILKRAEDRISYNKLLDMMMTKDRGEKLTEATKTFGLTDQNLEYIVQNMKRPKLVDIPYELFTAPDQTL